MDSKGSVRRCENLDELRSDVVEWEGDIQSYSAQRLGSSKESREDGLPSFECFGDFMKSFDREYLKFHVVDSLLRGGPEERAWSSFGSQCPVHEDTMEDMKDSIRIMVEKSDYLSGFMYLVEDTSVWGNVASNILEEMKDDYRGKAMFLFATRQDGLRHARDLRKNILHALAVSTISSLVDVYVPMYDCAAQSGGEDDLCSNTLMRAMGIHGASLPCRLTDSPMDMHSIADLISGKYQSPFAAIDMVFPEKRGWANDTSLVFEGGVFCTDMYIGTDNDLGRVAESISIEAPKHEKSIYERLRLDRTMRVQSVSTSLSGGLPVLPYLPVKFPTIAMDGTSTVPYVSRLSASSSWSRVLRELSSVYACEAKSKQGSDILESWGVSQDTVNEQCEFITSLADRYSYNL